MIFAKGQRVKVLHTDALGHKSQYDGKVVEWRENVKMYMVDIGSVAVAFNPEDIHAIEGSNAQVEGGTAPQWEQERSASQKPSSGHCDHAVRETR